jgi:hypothetical protein
MITQKVLYSPTWAYLETPRAILGPNEEYKTFESTTIVSPSRMIGDNAYLEFQPT